MPFNFDHIINRLGTGSAKWESYGPDVLPLWVADMDFAVPEPIKDALHARVHHGVFGYAVSDFPELLELICERTEKLYGWKILPEQIMFFPGLTSALNTLCRAFGKHGDGVLVQPPIYYPFLSAVKNQGHEINYAQLKRKDSRDHITYEIDFDVFEDAITPHTNLFLLCNPHNPVGKMYSREELEHMAAICRRHNLVICSDEIHCELLLDGKHHVPTASLSSEIAENCITLMAPSKTFNLAGLRCGYAIIQNPTLMEKVRRAADGIIPGINVMGFTGALAAYQHGEQWLSELLPYLAENRDFAMRYLHDNIPDFQATCPEATYLMWLYCSNSAIPGNPAEFFLENAKVALEDGGKFGPGGEGFIRMNFACPRTTIAEALQRMQTALEAY